MQLELSSDRLFTSLPNALCVLEFLAMIIYRLHVVTCLGVSRAVSHVNVCKEQCHEGIINLTLSGHICNLSEDISHALDWQSVSRSTFAKESDTGALPSLGDGENLSQHGCLHEESNTCSIWETGNMNNKTLKRLIELLELGSVQRSAGQETRTWTEKGTIKTYESGHQSWKHLAKLILPASHQNTWRSSRKLNTFNYCEPTLPGATFIYHTVLTTHKNLQATREITLHDKMPVDPKWFIWLMPSS